MTVRDRYRPFLDLPAALVEELLAKAPVLSQTVVTQLSAGHARRNSRSGAVTRA